LKKARRQNRGQTFIRVGGRCIRYRVRDLDRRSSIDDDFAREDNAAVQEGRIT
jgi:hypothetical protein